MADSDLCSTSQWIQFFRNAGLPVNVAANYALIFFDNRIQQNMLMDLSKEYLYDMGIRVMGDVIAILRYSKEFHNQLAKEKILTVEKLPMLSAAKRSSPASRILDRYTRPAVTNVEPQKIANPPKKALPQKRLAAKRGSPLTASKVAKKLRLEEKSSYNVKVPEEEGAYNIKMPIGNTERSRRILEQMQNPPKKSVFSRLGDSDVSSSTDVKLSTSGSVFKRLGPSSSEVSTSSLEHADEPVLPYRGVLKPMKKIISTTAGSSVRSSGINSTSQNIRITKIIGATPHKMKTVATKSSLIGSRSLLLKSVGPTQKVSALTRLGVKSIGMTKRVVPVGNAGIAQVSNILRKNVQSNMSQRFTGLRAGTVQKQPIAHRIGVKAPFPAAGRIQLNKKVPTNNASFQNTRLQQKSVFDRLGK